MNTRVITEGLDYHDLEGQIDPTVNVDEYSAKMGDDSEIITLSFVVKNKAAGNDLADWFERGYDYVLDAQVSEGEVSPNRYLVFVEMNRRTSASERIIEIINDLQTLTALKLRDWTVVVNEESYDADIEVLNQVLTTSPHEYRKMKEQEEKELNSVRESAGLEPVKIFQKQDSEIKKFKAMAGL